MDGAMSPTQTADGREMQEHVQSAQSQSQQFKTLDDSSRGLRDVAENSEVGVKKNLHSSYSEMVG